MCEKNKNHLTLQKDIEKNIVISKNLQTGSFMFAPFVFFFNLEAHARAFPIESIRFKLPN